MKKVVFYVMLKGLASLVPGKIILLLYHKLLLCSGFAHTFQRDMAQGLDISVFV